MLAPVEAELEAAQKNLDAQEEEPQRRASRRMEIPKTIAADRLKLDEMQQSSGAAAKDESAAMIEAGLISRAASRRALEAEISALEKELQSYDTVSAELLKLDHEAAQRKVAELQQRVTAWQEAINDRRRAEADRQASEAHWAAVTAEPAVRQLADENSALSDQRQQLAEQMEQLADDAKTIQQRLEKLSDEFKDVQDKVSIAGLTDAVGQMLRKQRSELATIDADRLAIRRRHDEIARVQVQLFDLEEELSDLHDVDARARQISRTLQEGTQAKNDDLRSLFKTRQKYIDNLLKDYNSYFAALVSLDSKQQELLSESEKYRSYIDQRVLWIRSTHPLAWGDVRKAGDAIGWIARPIHWRAALKNVGDQARTNPIIVALAALLFASCLWIQRQLKLVLAGKHAASNKAWLQALGRGDECDSVAGGFVARRLVVLPDARARMSTGSARHSAPPWNELPRCCCRCWWCGTFVARVDWRNRTLAGRPRRWSRCVGNCVADRAGPSAGRDGGHARFSNQRRLERFVGPDAVYRQSVTARRVFICHAAAADGFLASLDDPAAQQLGSSAGVSGVFSAGAVAADIKRSGRQRLLLHRAAIGQPLAIDGMVGADRGVNASVGFALADGNLSAFGDSSGVAQRACSMHRRPVRRSAAMNCPISIWKKSIRKLTVCCTAWCVLGLAVGLYLVWIDVLPALRVFDQVTLWSDGANAVSLVNLVEACLVAVMAIMAATNLPGLLEFAILQRLPLDNGVRYALSAVIRYTIAIVGLVLGGGAIGIGWPKVQWLAAAVTFGLGFGLQEIFANFVSGLIVLFERPIRVGDTVTVGDVTGVVSRIRMRATTILDGDRKELIVPNKEFITAKLVNWTLSDSVTRLIVRLNIAYGCDTQQVQQLLLCVAAETPAVLKAPAPKAVFMGFSEKWIDFELRVFVGNVEALLSTRHQLNMAVDRAFRANGVQLAQPPRDPTLAPLTVASQTIDCPPLEKSQSKAA